MAKKTVDINKLDNNQKIRALFKIFKKHLPLHKPVKLIIRELAYDDGMCGWAGDGRKGFVISINKNLCYNCKIDTLIHEVILYRITHERRYHKVLLRCKI